jgi:hypothetical protein
MQGVGSEGTRRFAVVNAILENRAMQWGMHELLTAENENGGELVVPAAQNVNGYKGGDGESAHHKPFPDSAVDLPISHARSWAFWSIFRFVKETYVWLVWIPLLLLGLGISMNFLAVTMNHGIMPVVLPASGIIAHEDNMHVAATANSRFLFLCDWIQLHASRDVASPGDFLITTGGFLKWPFVWMWLGFSWGQSTWRKLIGSYANI